jgi:5'-3' exonuclease
LILLDLSQTLIASLMVTLGGKLDQPIEVGLMRHITLNKIRFLNGQFRRKYGKLVIACDGRDYWRRDVFSYYKANRAVAREKSKIDWKHVHQIIDMLKDELRSNFPYTIIEHHKAEADDIMGVLARRFGGEDDPFDIASEPILIISGDNDFVQLQKYDNVSQYNSVLKKWVTTNDVDAALFQKIVTGDSGDGIPNILSDDDSIINPDKRQRPLRTTKLEEWTLNRNGGNPDWTDLMHRNFQRNQTLIDLTHTPQYIADDINDQFDKGPSVADRSGIYKYMVANRLALLSDYISDF